MPAETPTEAAEHYCPACQSRYASTLQFCPKDGTALILASDTNRPSLIGQVLADRYRIVRKVGEGGMGEVFEARHVYIDKRYAIKTLRPEITANAEAVARFHQEARSASTIGHENIIEVDDFGRLTDGGVYLAMEFLDGDSLAERMRHGPVPADEAVEYIKQVCRGLAAAHAKGIIHRDLKPENIFLARKGTRTVVKVLDFGIAKVVNDSAAERLTRTGSIFGTPFYMSPEQALGRSLDARTDIYSVGVILYELWAGKVPFHADTFMGILSMHITTAPVPPSLAAPDRNVPMGMERIILRAMAKTPEERQPSMQALLDELERFSTATQEMRLLGPPVATHPPSAELPPGSYLHRVMPTSELPGERFSPAQPAAGPTPGSAAEAALELDRPVAPSVDLGAAGAELVPARSRAPVWAAVLVGGALVGGGAYFATHRPAPAPVTTVEPSPGAPAPAAPLPPPSPPAPAPATGAEAYAEVVVDTVPSGAKVYAAGQLIAETPDAIKVPTGKSLEVLVQKPGYVARQLVLDPARKRKEVIRLEREHRAPGAPDPRPLPTLPPGTAPAAAPTSPAAPTRTVAPVRIEDPYQALPPPSRHPKPAAPASPSGDVMDPYH